MPSAMLLKTRATKSTSKAFQSKKLSANSLAEDRILKGFDFPLFLYNTVMKLAASSHQKLEIFFREYLDDKDFRLPKIHFYVGKFTRIFTTVLQLHGITFGRRIFILPKFLMINQENLLTLPEKLIAHEVTHVIQYRREGFVIFFYKYTTNFWKNLRTKKKWDIDSRQQAYLEIPFEIEAREVADKFVEWSESEKVKK